MSAPEPAAAAPSPVGRRGWCTLSRRRVALVLLILTVVGAAGWRYRITRLDYRFARGQDAVQARDWDQVIEFANKLESAGHPDHARFLRARALHAKQRPDLALAQLNEMSPESPLRLQAAALSGRCLLDLGDLRSADAVFQTVIDEQPDHVDAHRGLAVIAYDLGQLTEAVEHLQKVAELDPKDARPHRLMGLIYKDMAQDAQAEVAYREALRRGAPPESEAEVRFEFATVLARQGKFAEGLAELGDAGTDPARVAVRVECLRGLGRTREAGEELDRALGTHQTATLFRLRGQVHQSQNQIPEALKAFERAAELGPTDHQSHYLLAQAYATAGRKEDADRAFARESALRKTLDRMTVLSKEAMQKPWDAGVRRELAQLSDQMGMPEVAAMWRKAAAACSRGE